MCHFQGMLKRLTRKITFISFLLHDTHVTIVRINPKLPKRIQKDSRTQKFLLLLYYMPEDLRDLLMQA